MRKRVLSHECTLRKASLPVACAHTQKRVHTDTLFFKNTPSQTQSFTYSLRPYLQSERKMKETRISQSLTLNITEAGVTNHLKPLNRKREDNYHCQQRYNHCHSWRLVTVTLIVIQTVHTPILQLKDKAGFI